MRSLSRRTFASLTALVVSFAAFPEDARADIFGGDVAVLAAILTQSIATVINTADTVIQLKNQIEMMVHMLKNLDISSWDDLKNLYFESKWLTESVMGGIEMLAFNLNELKNNWKRVYPTNYRPIPSSRFGGLVNRWNKETIAAAELTARAQTSLGSLESIERTADHVIQNSQKADNELKQLQLTVQMLGVLHRQLSIMVQSMTTAARLQANVAAAEASERAMALEKKQRNLKDYNKKGTASPPVRALP